MLATTQITTTGTDITVYTCPTNKKGMLEVFIKPIENPALTIITLNDLLFLKETISTTYSFKIMLSSGDVMKVNVDNPVNVFVTGMEVA